MSVASARCQISSGTEAEKLQADTLTVPLARTRARRQRDEEDERALVACALKCALLGNSHPLPSCLSLSICLMRAQPGSCVYVCVCVGKCKSVCVCVCVKAVIFRFVLEFVFVGQHGEHPQQHPQ